MIEKNIIVMTEGSEEVLQGMIRGIEALDSDRRIGIIYGAHNSKGLSESEGVLLDVTKAVIVCTMDFNLGESLGNYKCIPLAFPSDVLEGDRNIVINFIKEYYSNIVEDIINC